MYWALRIVYQWKTLVVVLGLPCRVHYHMYYGSHVECCLELFRPPAQPPMWALVCSLLQSVINHAILCSRNTWICCLQATWRVSMCLTLPHPIFRISTIWISKPQWKVYPSIEGQNDVFFQRIIFSVLYQNIIISDGITLYYSSLTGVQSQFCSFTLC